jgi:hypothetical protein
LHGSDDAAGKAAQPTPIPYNPQSREENAKADPCLISCNSISKMASLLYLQDVKKLSSTLQSFYSQIIIKKMRNPFEMSAFHIEGSG